MSNHYKHILINDVQHIVAVNPFRKMLAEHEWQDFDKANPPIVWDGPAFEGTKDESEIEIGLAVEMRVTPNKWRFLFEGENVEDLRLIGKEVFQAARPKEVADHIGEINGMVNQPVQQEEYNADDLCENFQSVQPYTPIVEEQTCPTCNKAENITCSNSYHVVSEGEEKDYLINTKSAYSVYVAGFNHGFNEQNIIPEHGTIEAFKRLMNGESPCLDGTMYNIPKQSLSNREEGRELQRPSVKDYFDTLTDTLNSYKASPKLFAYAQALDRFIDELSPSSTPLEQKELKAITEEDLIVIAKLSHQMPKAAFKVVGRDEDMAHVEYKDECGITYHISFKYKYGTVNANMHFDATDKEPFSTSSVNIGEIQNSAKQPVPYIAIYQYLQSRYKLPKYY